jgi:uncharacterized OB-fold protein
VSFALPICAACGRAAFPPRALCPSCGGREWTTGDGSPGTVEETTERDGVRVVSVRTSLGPVVIARAEVAVEPGDAVTLESDAGVPVVRGRHI